MHINGHTPNPRHVHQHRTLTHFRKIETKFLTYNYEIQLVQTSETTAVDQQSDEAAADDPPPPPKNHRNSPTPLIESK
jgi:hypothetical protein